jgi:hypothetical protein
MNVLAKRIVLTVVGFVWVGVVAVALAGPVLASHVHVSATVPSGAALGEMMRMPVALQAEDGAPLKGTTVVFYLHAAFAGVTGEAEIGRAVTDDSGVATLVYRPRLAGHHEVRMEYLTPGEDTVEVVSTAFDVAGTEQLYRSAANVEIPGVSGGLLMAVLGTVWSILLWVAFRFVAIARAGGEVATPAEIATAVPPETR